MNKQCYLTYASSEMKSFMRSKGFKGRVMTHRNKGKTYPYNSVKRGWPMPGYSYKAKMQSVVVSG